jgi:hypothetical protein
VLQVTEDGGAHWRKIEQFPGVPAWTYVSDVFASVRDPNAVFVALNNWQRGDYKPYLLKSPTAGDVDVHRRRFAGPSRRLGCRPGSCELQPVVCRDGVRRLHVVDGGGHWIALKGGVPVAQVRDLAIQRRENDLVDRDVRPRLLRPGRLLAAARDERAGVVEDVHLFALRDASLFNPLGQAPAGAAGLGAMAGNWTAPNPPFGAVFTFNLRQDVPDPRSW